MLGFCLIDDVQVALSALLVKAPRSSIAERNLPEFDHACELLLRGDGRTQLFPNRLVSPLLCFSLLTHSQHEPSILSLLGSGSPVIVQ